MRNTKFNKKGNRDVDELSNVDYVVTNANSSQSESQLYNFEHNEAVIKMIIKGRSPKKRHVSRPRRVALDWFFAKSKSIMLTPKNQLADMITRGSFTRDEWNHLLCLFNISHLSSTNCLEVMSKRTQKESGEERVTAKSKPMMNLVSRCSERTPDVLASIASESSGKTRYESQQPLSSWIEQHQRRGRPALDARHFLSNRKQSTMSKKAQESKTKEGLAVAKPRPTCLVSRNLLTAKQTFPEAQANLRETGAKTQQLILKSGKKMKIRFEAQGNLREVSKTNLQGQGLTAAVFAPRMLYTLRKSPRPLDKS